MIIKNKTTLIEYHRKLPEEKDIIRNIKNKKRSRRYHFYKIRAHHSCLYNALLEIRLERGDNITTH